jgi:hypothetical protein
MWMGLYCEEINTTMMNAKTRNVENGFIVYVNYVILIKDRTETINMERVLIDGSNYNQSGKIDICDNVVVSLDQKTISISSSIDNFEILTMQEYMDKYHFEKTKTLDYIIGKDLSTKLEKLFISCVNNSLEYSVIDAFDDYNQFMKIRGAGKSLRWEYINLRNEDGINLRR